MRMYVVQAFVSTWFVPSTFVPQNRTTCLHGRGTPQCLFYGRKREFHAIAKSRRSTASLEDVKSIGCDVEQLGDNVFLNALEV